MYQNDRLFLELSEDLVVSNTVVAPKGSRVWGSFSYYVPNSNNQKFYVNANMIELPNGDSLNMQNKEILVDLSNTASASSNTRNFNQDSNDIVKK